MEATVSWVLPTILSDANLQGCILGEAEKTAASSVFDLHEDVYVFGFVGLCVRLCTRFPSNKAMASFETYRIFTKCYKEWLIRFWEHPE